LGSCLRLRRRFHQAKARHRFLGNERASAEAVLRRVCELGLAGLEGTELLALLDVSLQRSPMPGHLGLGHGRLLA